MARPRGSGSKRGAGKSTASSTALHDHEPEDDAGELHTTDEGEDCRLDGGVDGSFTRVPRERGDREAADLPDEEPPGWCAS